MFLRVAWWTQRTCGGCDSNKVSRRFSNTSKNQTVKQKVTIYIYFILELFVTNNKPFVSVWSNKSMEKHWVPQYISYLYRYFIFLCLYKWIMLFRIFNQVLGRDISKPAKTALSTNSSKPSIENKIISIFTKVIKYYHLIPLSLDESLNYSCSDNYIIDTI